MQLIHYHTLHDAFLLYYQYVGLQISLSFCLFTSVYAQCWMNGRPRQRERERSRYRVTNRNTLLFLFDGALWFFYKPVYSTGAWNIPILSERPQIRNK